ncbi:MAG: bifunctional demethylmenaquinone methyltransferase/2-methoxy-6-polyprenyl-1,4-benzoquinol methylase UbiE [Dehalococcoidia bacterium]
MNRLEGKAKASYVNALFARIARRYDFMNGVMTGGRHHAWRRLAVRLAASPGDTRALDVACGTGDFALDLARYPLEQVVGVDFCLEMVVLARQKAERLRLAPRVSFSLADALALPFPNERFNLVTVGFALRNVADLQRALEEMYRVLRPGGRLVSLELTPLQGGALSPLIHLYMDRVLPLLGRLLARDAEAYTYLPNSVTDFPTAEGLADALRQVGFARVQLRRLALGTVALHIGTKEPAP